MAKNIIKWSNIAAQIRHQPITLMMSFSSGVDLDPVLTGGTNIVWTSPAGVESTGGTPTPALDEAGRYVVTMDSLLDLTAIDATDDNLTCIQLNGLMRSLSTIQAADNPGLAVDDLVDQIYSLRDKLPAMTVNIGGSCPDVGPASISKIGTLTGAYGHTWTYNTDAFLFTVKTDNTGTSNPDQFTIPLPGTGTYDFIAYYDGQATAHTANTSLTLTMPSGAGTYGIAIVGTFPRIYFNNGGDKLKLTSITQFGDVGWGSDWTGAFYGCANLTDNLTLPTNLTLTTNTFRSTGLTGSVQALPIGVTNCSGMYQDAALDGTIADHSSSDGTLTDISNYLNGNSALTGNAEDFWNWDAPPTTTTGCYTGCTSLTDYATIPAAYGGGGIYDSVTAAYSVARVVVPGYAGDAILVRRASDNAEQSIGFVDGELDTASLATFCSGTDGYIKTTYDQKGIFNATQSNTINQYKIYDSSTGVLTDNGKPAGYPQGISTKLVTASWTEKAQPNTMFAVGSMDATTSSSMFDGNLSTRRNNCFSATNKFSMYAGAVQTGGTTIGTQQLFTCKFNGASSIGRVNGVGDISADTGAQGITGLTIGGNTSSQAAKTIQEVIYFNSDQTANFAAIELNINAYYGIY